jgi:hypothetical protein
MAEVLFNSDGYPLLGYGKEYFFSSVGGPLNKDATPSNPIQDADLSFSLADNEKVKVCPWGTNNDFPILAEAKISSSVVLWSGLKYKLQLFMGQGIFPCRVTGFNDSGDEILEILSDPVIKNFVRSRMVRRYLQNSYRDVLKYGISFPELIFNKDASQIVGINTINARHCRFIEAKNGLISGLVASAKFTSPDGKSAVTPAEKSDYSLLAVLDSYDPDADLERLRLSRKLSGNNFIYPIGNYFSNNDYYPTPDWLTAYNAGWFDISAKIPEFLKNVYNNQISWLWHVKIPYAYWERRYPPNQYKLQKEREALIQADMDLIEKNLTGTEAARKAIFSMFEVNHSGKPEEQWVIEALDNKYKSDQQMIESAVADSNILFSIGVNPTVMGAGLPGAGPYAGKTGGSDIRESFLVNVALAWLDRQNILDPLETFLSYNGIKDVELRFRNTILTTLDQGKGTQKIVS